MLKITKSEIEAAKDEQYRIDGIINEIGRKVYKIRKTKALDAEYYFHDYVIDIVDRPEHWYWEEILPDIDIGTEVISIRYRVEWQGGSDSISVVMPLEWLSGDWEALATDEAEKIFEAKRIEDEAKAAEREALKEQKDREEFERLKKKFIG